MSANETLKFGYFDELDGYYFTINNNELHCCVMNNTVETIIHQNEFNLDKADGTTSSLFNLDFLKGNIFHIDFTWYGYGAVIFSVMGINNLNTQDKIQLHRFDTYGQTSTNNPHLPISVELKSNSESVNNKNVYVGGRQYSLIGKYNPTVRYNSFYKYSDSFGTTTKPILSLKKISTMKPCRSRVNSIKVNTNVDTELSVVFDGTLNTSNYIVPSNVTESSIIQDTTATSVSGGFMLWTTIIFASDGTTTIDLPEDFKNIGIRPTTITGRSLGTTGNITAIATVEEHW